MFVPNVHCKLTVTDQSWSEKAKFCGEIMFSNVYQEDDPHSFLDCISWRFILLYRESHDYCFVYIIYTLFLYHTVSCFSFSTYVDFKVDVGEIQ